MKNLPESKNLYIGESKDGSIPFTGRPGPVGLMQSNMNTRGIRCMERDQSNGLFGNVLPHFGKQFDSANRIEEEEKESNEQRSTP